ncbi:MAG: hypothetical protein HYS34_05420 [Acidobacteria bacterium]|nr:hypothetical protein [Acidobacteriota bacterium]
MVSVGADHTADAHLLPRGIGQRHHHVGALDRGQLIEQCPGAVPQTRALLPLFEERMTRIVQDLLLLARADAGTLELRHEPVRLDALASGVIEEMNGLAEARRVALSREFSGPVMIVGDERWLRQMLYNLLDNAIKYTPPAGRVRVALEGRDGGAEICVSDTGPGIPEASQSRLFERFYRVDEARSREDGGAGLGLAIALWIARSHKGDIKVESRAGEGSTFRVVLPQG